MSHQGIIIKRFSFIKEWTRAFLSLFFPRCCLVCGRPLANGEEDICAGCDIRMPRTNYHLQKDNPIERLFWGRIPIVRATSYFFYRKGSDYRLILHRLKYRGQKEIGENMGRRMAAELLPYGFFEGINVIVPVPLHEKRQKRRGYNQSEQIARGIATVTGIPVETRWIARRKETETQTRKSVFERWENVEGGFELRIPTECLRGKHALVVDDVLTTGATTAACASTLTEAEGIQISILTLAVAE